MDSGGYVESFLKRVLAEERKNILRSTCTSAEYEESKEFPKKLNEKLATGAALFTESDEIQCVYCRGKYQHKECTEVTSLNDRKKLICKYARCFLCMKKGQRLQKKQKTVGIKKDAKTVRGTITLPFVPVNKSQKRCKKQTQM